jgi:hypothetical protein
MSLTKAQRAQQAQRDKADRLRMDGIMTARALWPTLSAPARAQRVTKAMEIAANPPAGPFSQGWASEIMRLESNAA